MRVLLTCDWFLKYAAAQAAGLARAGAEVLLMCRDHAMEFDGDEAERLRSLELASVAGVVVLEVPGRLADLTAVPTLRSIRKGIRKFSPDVVHVHDGADPRILALAPRVASVLTLHDPEPHPGQPVPSSTIKRLFLDRSRHAWRARANALIIHSERLRPQVKLRRRQRCVVIPHGLDLRTEPLPCPRELTVGLFGRLTPYKGLDVLARAMPLVWTTRPEVRLTIAGSGTSGFPLLDSRISFEDGYVPEEAVGSFFAKTSIAVLPYTQASQTGVGTLALSYGVPVVASRVGGLPDITLDASYLCEADNETDLAEAILRHIDDDASVRARVLRELAAPRSWDAVAARALDLYEDVTAQP